MENEINFVDRKKNCNISPNESLDSIKEEQSEDSENNQQMTSTIPKISSEGIRNSTDEDREDKNSFENKNNNKNVVLTSRQSRQGRKYAIKKVKTLITFFGDKSQNNYSGNKDKTKKKVQSKTTLLNLNNTLNSEVKAEAEGMDEEESILDTGRLGSLLKIIIKNHEEEKKLQVKQQRLAQTREKIWRVVAKLKGQRQKGHTISKIMLEEMNTPLSICQRIVMHPELSKVKLVFDFLVCGVLSVDLIMSPFEYLLLDPYSEDKTREILFDSFFLIEVMTQFFTAYFKNQILVTECKSIAFNYLKFRFLLDMLYIFPFWVFVPSLIYMRLTRVIRFPFLISKVRFLVFSFISLIIKNLKMIHSMVSIIIFSITLFFILHISSCIWVLIGRNGPTDNNWIYHGGLSDASKWEKYTASIYFLIETFITIGYGDLPPRTIPEIWYIMVCEVLNVGLFAYLISCIMDIISNFSTDEISFKYNNDIDVNIWMIKYNSNIPTKMKLELLKEKEPFFDIIKKYFLLYHKKDHSWIKKFSFLKQMRPHERNVILEYTFHSFFQSFNCFFSGLDLYFKTQVALNLKTKFLEKGSIIISETVGNNAEKSNQDKKNKIKYFYFVAKGIIGVYKRGFEICKLIPGSYFGDEHLITKHPNYTYKIIDSSHAYLFCCPIEIINSLCSNNEDSYLFLLYKALIKLNKTKQIYEEILERNNISLDIPDTKMKKFNSFYKKDNRKKKLSKLEVKDFDQSNPSSKRNTFSHKDKFAFSINSAPVLNENEIEDKIENDYYDENNFEREKLLDLTDKDIYEEYNNLLDDFNFLDKIDINEDNLGNMIKLKTKKEKFEHHLKYCNNLGKKMNFLKIQLEFIKNQFNNVMDKSNGIIKSIKDNEDKLFNDTIDKENNEKNSEEID